MPTALTDPSPKMVANTIETPPTEESFAKVRLLVPRDERGALDDMFRVFRKHVARPVLSAPSAEIALRRLERARPIADAFWQMYVATLGRYPKRAVQEGLRAAQSQIADALHARGAKEPAAVELRRAMDAARRTNARVANALASMAPTEPRSDHRGYVAYVQSSLLVDHLNSVCLMGLLGDVRATGKQLLALAQESHRMADQRDTLASEWLAVLRPPVAGDGVSMPARAVFTDAASVRVLALLEDPPEATPAMRRIMATRRLQGG